jgi:cell division protein FtsN
VPVDFEEEPAAVPRSASVPPRSSDEIAEALRGTLRNPRNSPVLHGYTVQIGAYRVRANAEETLQRARRSGVDARLHVSGELTIVGAGPYPSSDAASQDADRLRSAGLEAVVTSRK